MPALSPGAPHARTVSFRGGVRWVSFISRDGLGLEGAAREISNAPARRRVFARTQVMEEVCGSVLARLLGVRTDSTFRRAAEKRKKTLQLPETATRAYETRWVDG